jgi:hypothetical protein
MGKKFTKMKDKSSTDVIDDIAYDGYIKVIKYEDWSLVSEE